MNRNSGIEVYRCVLMYGICLLHCVHRVGIGVWADHFLMPCVCGFAVISGWFGVRFRPSKVLRLYGIQLFNCFVIMIANWMIKGTSPSVKWIIKYMHSYWFVHAYILLMMLAPLIDCAVERCRTALFSNIYMGVGT